MQFGDLQAIFNRSDCELCSNRIQLTLSDHAWIILNQQRQDFSLPDCSPREELPWSAIINHLTVQYHQEAKISIAQRLLEYKNKLNQLLATLNEADRDKAVATLLEDRRKELVDFQSMLYEKATSAGQAKHSVMIRINRTAIEELHNHFCSADEGCYYRNNIGRYLKFLLEEYARLDAATQEEIFYRPWLEPRKGDIPLAIDGHKELQVTLRHDAPGNQTPFRPFAVHLDEGSRYHYLLGYWDPNRDGQWQAACLRINSLYDVKEGCNCLPFSKTERQSLQRQIAQKGVAYLSDSASAVCIRVQLTLKGERLYRSMRHMRPLCTEAPGADRIYTFTCSLFQAKNYFLRFGKEARILEPDSLRQDIVRFFQDGLDANTSTLED